eukprot:XP_015580875.1 uncharacterized protein LOC107262053 [Ricinus communis]
MVHGANEDLYDCQKLFKGLFDVSGGLNIGKLDYVDSCVDDFDNQRLMALFTIEEFKTAIFQIRSIIDNVIAAFKFIHFMKRKTRGRHSAVALKIDFIKAYDRPSWWYLKNIMRKMRFSSTWIDWIMMCVSTVQYWILVNKELVGPILPKRDLCQGCPLSPYLIILRAEGLSALLRRVERRADIHGCRICRDNARDDISMQLGVSSRLDIGRLQGWKNKFLSQVGREIMLKAVA